MVLGRFLTIFKCKKKKKTWTVINTDNYESQETKTEVLKISILIWRLS